MTLKSCWVCLHVGGAWMLRKGARSLTAAEWIGPFSHHALTGWLIAFGDTPQHGNCLHQTNTHILPRCKYSGNMSKCWKLERLNQIFSMFITKVISQLFTCSFCIFFFISNECVQCCSKPCFTLSQHHIWIVTMWPVLYPDVFGFIQCASRWTALRLMFHVKHLLIHSQSKTNGCE